MEYDPTLRIVPQRDGGTLRAYTPRQFAALFGRHHTWAYRLLYRGLIRKIDFPAEEVERFVSCTVAHE